MGWEFTWISMHSLLEYPPFPDRLFFPRGIHTIQYTPGITCGTRGSFSEIYLHCRWPANTFDIKNQFKFIILIKLDDCAAVYMSFWQISWKRWRDPDRKIQKKKPHSFVFFEPKCKNGWDSMDGNLRVLLWSARFMFVKMINFKAQSANQNLTNTLLL